MNACALDDQGSLVASSRRADGDGCFVVYGSGRECVIVQNGSKEYERVHIRLERWF